MNTRPVPPIRDQLASDRRHEGTWTALTASAGVAMGVLLLLAAAGPAGATRLYAEIARTLTARLTPPINVEPGIRKVHETALYDEYSNGLVVMNTWRSAGKPRVSYPVFPASNTATFPQHWRSDPAGIVYHSTESHQVAMEAEWKPDVPPIEKYLLDYLRDRRVYHFFIDRTGRVFRVVPESEIANHAGKSVWGDDKYVYVNLNASFLGVAFERQALDHGARITPDQIQSGRLLTDMLRAKYDIPASNCVTHAQVSVNPARMMIGAHTDWAGDFPFAELGLGDNYAQPVPALFVFGFDYDQALVSAAGDRTWRGLLAAGEEIRQRASERGVSVPQYKSELQRRYWRIRAALDLQSAI